MVMLRGRRVKGPRQGETNLASRTTDARAATGARDRPGKAARRLTILAKLACALARSRASLGVHSSHVRGMRNGGSSRCKRSPNLASNAPHDLAHPETHAVGHYRPHRPRPSHTEYR